MFLRDLVDIAEDLGRRQTGAVPQRQWRTDGRGSRYVAKTREVDMTEIRGTNERPEKLETRKNERCRDGWEEKKNKRMNSAPG